MRKGFDGLAAQVQQVLQEDPFGGQLFLFRSRRGDRLKAVWWDGTGLCKPCSQNLCKGGKLGGCRQLPTRCWHWRAGWRRAVAARDLAQTIPSWPEIPSASRRRLAVLIGRLALRRLPSMNPEERRRPMRAPSQGTTGLVLPGKVQPRHLDRLAIVYVRQSTLQQLEQHRESTALQYGLAERACRLGWPRPRVSVIDDDLGCSGASAEGRPGFQRLVAEVGLGHVGLVLGFEVSRLARSCRDWYHLLEICALAGTLIADSDGIYDPALYNDRLLLGLKGTMSEAELHIMRARLEQGRWHKAERGELGFNLPRGYLKRASGEVVLDPDERVRDTVRLVFDVFERRGSVHGVLRYLVDHGIALPDRDRSGPARGEVVWRRPHRGAILNMLTSPTYTGAYVFGRRRAGGPSVGVRRRSGPPSRRQEDWRVLLPDRWPAYITWSTYEENQQRLSANRSKHKGVPRGGPSLLAGILFCGRCGHRMVTCYRNNGRDLRYDCTRDQVNHGAPHCQSLSGGALDALVTSLILEVLRPSAIEVSLQLAEDVELERARRHRQWALRLEQARYEVERAERQYDAVEPENRLVARTLEQRWEAALAAEAGLREEHARFLAREPPQLTAADREAIRALAEDIPALWRAATTTAAERKADRPAAAGAGRGHGGRGVGERRGRVLIGPAGGRAGTRWSGRCATPSSSRATPSCSTASVPCTRKGCARRRSPDPCRRMAGGRRMARASPRAACGRC